MIVIIIISTITWLPQVREYNFFKVREKSGSFTSNQGNLSIFWKSGKNEIRKVFKCCIKVETDSEYSI